MKKKRLISGLLVIAVIIGTTGILYLFQRLLVPKYQTGIVEGSMIEEYYKDKSDHEVIFLGDCEVYENVSTIRLWERYGITSYIRGSAQQLVWQSYYLLEDVLKYETPKAVVFNVLALKYDEPQNEAYNRMTLDGMRWSLSKVNSILESMNEDEHFIEYVFPLLRYHSRWSELNEDDFKYLFSKKLVTHNGYYMRVDVKPQGEFPEPMPLADYRFGDKPMEYLQKLADLCKEKGIELIFMKAPTEYPHWYEEWDKQVADFAAENDIAYINCLDYTEEIGLDMSTDTYDAGLHLNISGAEKLADYIGAYLIENCELNDYRDDKKYADIWQKKVDFYNQMKEQQYAEIEQYGELKSFGANAVKD